MKIVTSRKTSNKFYSLYDYLIIFTKYGSLGQQWYHCWVSLLTLQWYHCWYKCYLYIYIYTYSFELEFQNSLHCLFIISLSERKHDFTERIACILCMHLASWPFFRHITALMHLKNWILRECIELHFIFLAQTRMGSH